MQLVFILLVLLAGVMAPTQAGINSQLSQYLRSYYLAALVSFFVGSIALLAFNLLLRSPLPALEDISRSPWWVWLGGFCGAFLVTVTIAAVPRLGATTMFAFFLAGQMLASLLLDHFGLMGYPQQSINLWRVAGVILLLSGALLVRKF
ncbi:MAG: DMT family transporter [Thermodesulfobacteriota bacterium]